MKLKYLYFAIAALSNAFLVSCSDFQRERMDVMDFDISDNILKFDVVPSEIQTVDITTETSWEVVVDQGVGDWLTVSPLEGTGNTTLTFTADKNTGPARSAMATVAAKGAEIQNIIISQRGNNGDKYNLGNFEGLFLSGVDGSGIVPITIVDNEECEDGKGIRIYTRPGEEHEGTYGDRFKVNTSKKYASGRYEWRVYVPEMGMNDRTSIGAFLYNDDRHELDFEIASGRAEERARYGAAYDEVLCLVSSQANPFVGETKCIKSEAWHILVLDLKLQDDKYLAEWLVDGERIALKQLDFGEEYYFNAIFSLENLYGMGDHAATRENYAIFDYFEYVPYEYSGKPIGGGDAEPEPEGETVKWDFESAGFPAEWTNNGGTIEDGWLTLSHGNSIKYKENVGPGKYTFEIDVPEVGVGEKWLSGLNITVNNVEAERSFSMFVFPGTENDRKSCIPAPLPGQMLVRCYTESLGVYGVPIDPGKHTLTLDLRLNEEGAYSASWIVDGELAKTFQTWYTPEEFTFDLGFTTMANGGGWQGDKETADTYNAKYNYIEYKKYNYTAE